MVRKKICLLGTSAVGKTSLVNRFVNNAFSEKYLTTVGVRISKKTIQIDSNRVEMLIWDLNGEDRFQKLSTSYLRGASGIFMVADGSRADTLESAKLIYRRVSGDVGKLAVCLLLNKADLQEDWEISDDDLANLKSEGWKIFLTSAKTGTGVEEAFETLASMLVPNE
ncbi:MAG: GTP-binding protein [Rhodothermales bacterium]|nr:GTP-binding protein [Rhodothermales bacterium]